MGFVSIDQIAGQDQLKCTAFANKTREPLGATVPGNDSKLDFRLPEPRIFRGDAKGAGHRRFTTASQGEAIHRCNYGLAKCFDERESLLTPLGELTCLLAVDGRELCDIGTGNERFLSRSSQDYTLDSGILFRRMKRRVKFLNSLSVERIHHLRAIHRDVSGRSFHLIRDVFEAGGHFCSTHGTSPLPAKWVSPERGLVLLPAPLVVPLHSRAMPLPFLQKRRVRAILVRC